MTSQRLTLLDPTGPYNADDSDPEGPFSKPRLWLVAVRGIGNAPLLPAEAPRGSHAADTAALVGDALLKAAIYQELGAGSGDESLRVGTLTRRAAPALSNALLASSALKLLCKSEGAPLRPDDILRLGEHGRATAVEAAVYAVTVSGGDAGAAAVRDLAHALLEWSAHMRDSKGLLIEEGGTVLVREEIVPDGAARFTATASLSGTTAQSRGYFASRRAAEADAAEVLLREIEVTKNEGKRVNHSHRGPEAVVPLNLGDYLSGDSYNMKGALLERGGSVNSLQIIRDGRPLFSATATLGENVATPTLPQLRRAAAENEACALVLATAGLILQKDVARVIGSDPSAQPFTQADIESRTSAIGPSWKSMLFERGGSIETISLARGQFTSIAKWREYSATCEPQMSKKAAEAIAAEKVMQSAGLLP